MQFTRDSLFWWISMIGAAAAAIGSHFDLFPWMPDRVQHGIELVSFLYAVFSGKMATSPLPSKHDL